jgi:putative transposase
LISRPLRIAEGGIVYHTPNRAVARRAIFEDDGDYAAFERALAEALGPDRMRPLADCIMPNHFHLVLWPRGDGELPRFLRWLTMTDTQRWHAHRHTAGTGHL